MIAAKIRRTFRNAPGVSMLMRVARFETHGIHSAAYLLAAFALGSQLLALIRDRLLAHAFGASQTLDLYYAAFRLPDLLFATVASLLSLYALLPVLSRFEAERQGSAAAFIRQTLGAFFIGMGAVAAVAFVAAPAILRFIAPGIAQSPESFASLLLLTRVLLLQPILLGASNILANLTQLRHRFFLYSVSPLLYNLGIIIGIVALYPRFGLPGLAWGVVIGAALHALVQLPFFAAEPNSGRLPAGAFLRSLKEVLVLSVPRTLSLAAGQISLLLIIAIASYLATGSISVFMFAFNLQAVPLTIIGVSYSVAAFPTLSRLMAENERAEFLRHIESALRHILFWSIPATILIIVLRAHIVRAILGTGAFDWDATRLTAAALALFVLSLLFQSVWLLLARAYYAAGNTLKPLLLGLFEVVVSVGSALCLMWLFQRSPLMQSFMESLLRVEDVPGTAVLMLALGFALGSTLKCLAGFGLFVREYGLSAAPLILLAFQSFCAAVLGGAAAYVTLQLFGTAVDTTTLLGILVQGGAAGSIGLIAAGAVLWLLGSRELKEALGALKSKLAAPTPALEPSDVQGS